MFDKFLSVLSLVSRFPVKGRFRFDASRMDFFLPITGLFPAVLGFVCYFAALRLTGLHAFAAAAALFLQYIGYNLFHLDGLADTADAFLGSVSREKRFAILKDSRIGVYGLFAGISAPAFKFLLLYGLLRGVENPLSRLIVFVYPLAGRFAAGLIPCMTVPARQDGLGALAGSSKTGFALTGAIPAFLVWAGLSFAASAFSGLTLILAVCAAALLSGVLCAVFYARVYGRGLGGFTGDALGAAIETGEAASLLSAAIVFNTLNT
ncbi:MAG: adenosylcobinamide-GDP ribazoletransferase [Spirochaetaceae bacterium]|jgi:adenosylcobinamide-GDP ribazoletransferase|nr:adenosylcobinamide-GDP ribazoletransferase [Spirochaetaceae bacterium]